MSSLYWGIIILRSREIKGKEKAKEREKEGGEIDFRIRSIKLFTTVLKICRMGVKWTSTFPKAFTSFCDHNKFEVLNNIISLNSHST